MLALTGQAVSEMFGNYVNIHVHGPGAGTDTPTGLKLLYQHKPSVTLVFCFKIFLLNDFLRDFPI